MTAVLGDYRIIDRHRQSSVAFLSPILLETIDDSIVPQNSGHAIENTKLSIVSGSDGNQTAFFKTLANVPVALSYGLAVFPLWRELIILGTAFLLLLGGQRSWVPIAFGGMLLLQGLLFMRLGYLAPQLVAGNGAAWPVWLGVVHMLGGFGVLLASSFPASHTQELSSNG